MHRRKGLTAAIVGVVSIALVVGAVGAGLAADNTVSAADNTRNAKLTGKAEVPGTGDDDGRGSVSLSLKLQAKEIAYFINFNGIQDPVAGHIHKGTKKVAGPIKVTLFENDAGVTRPVSDTVKAKKKLIKKIKNNPNNYYVNLHTPDFPDGAIRGQLRPGG
jgi:hypothetical protein